MRNLIYAINVTVDGCCDHTKGEGNDEILEHYTHLLREVDLLIYGRKTYQLMVPYWPDVAKKGLGTKAAVEFAQTFDSINRVVFSRSLDRAEEANARIARGSLQDEVLKLKQATGKDILVGGVDVPSQLIELGLVDEYRIVVQPFVAGAGRRLLDHVDLPEKRRLEFIDSKTLQSGSVALRYRKQ